MASTHNEALDQNISINASPDELKRNDLPFFAEPLTDVRVKVGSRMRLSTDIRSSTMLKVTWFRENKRIQMGGRFFMIDKGNFQSIDIMPVIAHDEGQWTCLAENSYGNSTCSFFLSVIIPKIYQLPNFINNVQVLITEAGTVLLECQVFGVPTPLLQWFKDGEEITAGDIFALTTRTNDTTLLGYYSCKAVNCMGIASSLSKAHIITSKSMEISLGVRNFQTSLTRAPMLSNILKKKNCIIGDCIALTCEINFLPESKLYWFNRQGRVSSSEKYQIMEEEGSFSVKITEIDANDEGLWKCVAERGENMTHIMSYDLTILIPKSYSYPKFKEPLKVIISKKGIVSFECKVVGIPTPTLKWYRNDQELKRDDIYCITTTSPLGSYCCVARNCMGEVKSTAELTIETIKNYLRKTDLSFSKNANIPYFRRGLENVKAEINSKFRFTVQVDISFRDTLHWYRNDNLIVSSVDYRSVEGKYGEHHLEIEKLKIIDDANWRCVVGNDYGYNETSCYLKLIIPKHYKKPEFLENLKVICTEAGQINLECKIKGVPSPTLQWFNGNVELQQGVIQKITPTNDNDCSLGTYTCQASNCMGTVKNSILLVGISNIFTREKISKTHEISEEPNTQKKEVKDKICIKLSCNNQHIIHDLVQTTDGQVEAIVTDEITKLISGENVTTVPSVKLMLKTFSDESLNYNENSEEKDKDDDNKPNEGSEKKSQNRKCSRDNGAKNDDECTDEEQRKITIQKIGVQIYRSEEELFQKNSNQSITPHYQEHTEGIVSRCNYENLDNKAVESICDFRKTEQASENRERLSNDLHSYLHTITTQLEREGDTYIRNEASEVWEDAEIENEHHVQETNTYENKRKERLENSTEIGEKIGVPCENQNLVYGVQDILCDYRIIDEVEKSKEKLCNESTIHTNQYAKTTELEKEEETQIFERDTDYTKAGNDDIELNIDTVEMQGPLLEKKILNDQSGVLSIDHDSENELERRTEIGPDFSLLDIREENSQKVMDSFGTENICIKNDTKDEKKNKESHHVRAIDTYKNEQDESLEHSTKTIGKITDDDNSCIIDDIELNFDSVGTEGLNELKRHTEINPGFSLSDIKTENIREDIDVVGTEKICTADDMKEEKQNYIGQKNHGLEASDNKRNISILEKDVGKEAEIGNQHYVRAEDPHKNKHEEILEHSTEKIEKNTVPCENRNFANKAQDNLCDFQKIDEVEENGEKLYNEYSDFNLYTDDTELERKGDNQIFNRDTDYTNADDVLYKIDEIELKINTVETQGPLIEKELLDDRSGIISSIDHKSENELEKNSEICPGFSFTDISNENSKKGMDLSEKEKIDITNYTNVERDGEKLYDEYLYPNSYTKTPEDKREEDTQIFNRETDRTNADDDVLCTTNDIESNEDTVDMQGPIVEENRLTDQKRIILSINHDIENQTEKQTENGPGVLLTDIGNENVQKSLDLFDDEKICIANDTEEEKENKLAEKNHGFEEIRNEKHLPIQEDKASDDGTYVNNKNQHHVRATDTHENEQESLTHSTEKIEKNTVPCENLNSENEAQDNLCDFQQIEEVEENREQLYNEYLRLNSYTENTELEREGDNQIFNRDTDYMNADDDLFCIIDDIELKIHTVEIHGPLLEEELLDDRSGTILFIDYKSENELERHSENGLGFSLTNIRKENSQKGMDSFETEKIRVANDTEGQTQNETGQKNHGSEKSDNKWHISIQDDEASKVGKDVEIENQHIVRAIDTHKYQQDKQLEHSTKKIEKNTVPCENENFANKAQDNLCDLQKIDEVEENGDDVVLCLINDIKLSMDTVGVQASVREEKSLDDQTKFISTIYSDSKNKVGIEPRIESVFLLANIEKRNGQKEKNFIESMKMCIENDTQENKINPLCTKYPGIEKINSKWSLPTLESNMLDSWEVVENENQQNVPVIDTHKCARSWKKPSSFLCVMSMKNLASIPKQRSTILTVFEKRLPIQVNRFELVNQAVSSNYKRINRTNTDLRSRKGFRIIREITPSISQYPYEQFSVRPVNRYDQLNNSRRFLNYGIYTQRNQSFTKLLDLSHYFDQIELESSPSKLCLKKTSQYSQLPYFLGQLPSSSKRYARSFNYLSTSNCFPINRLNSKGGKPKFFISLQNKMTIETSWVKLTCTVFADPNPEVFWFKDGNRLSLYSSNHVVNIVNGVVTLEIYSVRPQDSGEYSCWARNMYGLASTEATLKVTSLYSRVAAVQTHINIVKKSHEYGFLIRRTRTDMDGLMNTYGYKNFSRSLFEMSRNSMKPATFVCRPLIKEIAIAINGCMRISFQMSGIPTPKVIVLRERRNIMYDRRLHHEIHNDYVMIRLERAQPSDEGSYCIIVQNCFGCDRHFFTMKVTKPSGFVRRDMSPWMKKSYDNRYGF
ncbi:uncharacterized protein LOC122858328 isoform X2 [Aphidius gifuensis]|nr:uncharacterized protein LOC122858328 isoform X2 [Aphidius gifuensis]XP_044017085.1 uncharacterized protein LOC122858328 isoform X2 [Aphidius gifuensis]